MTNVSNQPNSLAQPRRKSTLSLDWTLETAVDRTAFLEDYLASRTTPLSESDLEMCGNYILWGRGSNGLNAEQEGYVQLERRNSTWASSTNTRQISSIEELTENPTFDEAQFHSLSDTAYKTPKPNFSREECLRKAPPEFIPMLRDLFGRIDRIELSIGFYDRAHGKRKTDLPERLTRKFSPDELFDLEERALSWTNGQYLKKKHLLVELRREQYTIKDSFSNSLMARPTNKFVEEFSPTFCGPESEEDGFLVLPLGLSGSARQAQGKSKSVDWFLEFEELAAKKDDPAYRMQASKLEDRLIERGICQPQKASRVRVGRTVKAQEPQGSLRTQGSISNSIEILDSSKTPTSISTPKPTCAALSQKTVIPFGFLTIDFRDPAHICRLLDSQKLLITDPSLSQVRDTLDFYMRQANLTPVQQKVLELKLAGKQNMDIKEIVNKEFGRSYQTNYISTIYRQYVAPAIADAASRHLEIVRAIAEGPERFKRCSVCGRLLVESETYFIHKSRAKSGFSTRCKQCDHDYRQRRK